MKKLGETSKLIMHILLPTIGCRIGLKNLNKESRTGQYYARIASCCRFRKCGSNHFFRKLVLDFHLFEWKCIKTHEILGSTSIIAVR